MTRTVKKGSLFYPGIDTNYDRLGAASEFSMEITRASDGVVVDNAVPGAEFEEVLMSFDLHTAEVSEDANKGRKTFKVKNSDLVIGDRIKIVDDYYNVINIVNDLVTINGKLANALVSDEAVNTVGNTGIYKIAAQIDIEGFYFCTIAHKDFGHAAVKYKIVPNNTVDVMAELNTIKATLAQNSIDICECSEDAKDLLSGQLTQVENGLRQVMIGLEDEINENEVIITNRSKTMKLII